MLALLLFQCACSAPPFTIAITNDGDAVTYLDQWGTGSPVTLSELRNAGEAPVKLDKARWCSVVCGTRERSCSRDLNFAAFALLPGDSFLIEFTGGAAWYLSEGYEGDCIRPTGLDNPIRVEVCRGDETQSAWSGVPGEEPTASGVMEGADVVVESTCEQFDFALAESADLQVSLE